ncbi:MAG: tRNA lysidine(34) synthetase TilS [Oscillospiraceae bacterium]
MRMEKVWRFAEKYDMLPPGARVLCAVSGGADSVCLLHLLRGREDIGLVCAHFNHRLRGEESDRDQRFVEELCAAWGIPFVCGSGDTAAYARDKGLGIEEAARELRYAFLERAAEETGCDRIAAAHSADDNAETVLFNLARGSGLKGLCGIPPVRGRIVRPLLCLTRREIDEYLAAEGLSHVEDSSNAGDGYSRNRIRHHVLPGLREENPAAVENIFAACESLRADEEYLSSQADTFIKENWKDDSLPVSGLTALPPPVMMRVFRALCGSGLSRVHAESLRMLCLNRALSASVDVPGRRVTKELDRLYFGPRPTPRPIDPVELRAGESVALPRAGLQISCQELEKAGEIHNSFNIFYLKSENICGKLRLSSRMEGDSIRLKGRGCTKSVRKLFSEAGLSPEKRILTPVLRDDVGVVAVYGFGTAERCAGEQGDHVIQIQMRKMSEEELSKWQRI